MVYHARFIKMFTLTKSFICQIFKNYQKTIVRCAHWSMAGRTLQGRHRTLSAEAAQMSIGVKLARRVPDLDNLTISKG